MDKQQAYYSLWSNFGISAYDENSVPDDAKTPYITYQVLTDSLDRPLFPTASLWYRSTTWAGIDAKLEEITSYIDNMLPIELANGEYMNVTRNTPWSQRLSDDTDRLMKRYILNLGVEFFSKY